MCLELPVPCGGVLGILGEQQALLDNFSHPSVDYLMESR